MWIKNITMFVFCLVTLLAIAYGVAGKNFYCNENSQNWTNAVMDCWMAGGILAPFSLGSGALLSNILDINAGVQVWTGDFTNGVNINNFNPYDINNYECGYISRLDDSHGFSDIKYSDCDVERYYLCKKCQQGGKCTYVEMYNDWKTANNDCNKLWNGQEHIDNSLMHFNYYWVNKVRCIAYQEIGGSFPPPQPTKCGVYTSGRGLTYGSCDTNLRSICKLKTNPMTNQHDLTRSCFKTLTSATTQTPFKTLTSATTQTPFVMSLQQRQTKTFTSKNGQSTTTTVSYVNNHKSEMIKKSTPYSQSSPFFSSRISKTNQYNTLYHHTNPTNNSYWQTHPTRKSTQSHLTNWNKETKMLSGATSAHMPSTGYTDVKYRPTDNQEHLTNLFKSTSTISGIIITDPTSAGGETQEKESTNSEMHNYGLTVALPILAVIIIAVVVILIIVHWRKRISKLNEDRQNDEAVYLEIQEIKPTTPQAHVNATYELSPNIDVIKSQRDKNGNYNIYISDKNQSPIYSFTSDRNQSPAYSFASETNNESQEVQSNAPATTDNLDDSPRNDIFMTYNFASVNQDFTERT